MNLTSKFIGIAKAITLSGALGLTLFANNASAQTVRNADEPGRNPYQYTGKVDCYNRSSCAFDFPPVPAGKRLVIQSISVSVATKESNPTLKQVVLTDFYGAITHNLPLEYRGGDSFIGYFFTTNQSVLHYYNPGDTPRLLAQVYGTSVVRKANFTMTGYVIKLP